MQKGKEIYVVTGSMGSYDSYHSWVVGVTFDQKKAKQIAKLYNKEHIDEPKLPMTVEEYNDLEYKYNREEYWNKNDEIDFSKINDPKYTPDIIDTMESYINREYMEYHPANIKLMPVFYESNTEKP